MTSAAGDEIARRQAAVEELRNNLDLREDLAVVGEDVRAGIHPDWMKRWGSKSPWWTRLAHALPPLFLVSS